MVPVGTLDRLPIFRDLPAPVLGPLSEKAEELEVERQSELVRQHDLADHVFILLSGSVQFLIRFEGVDHLLVGTTREEGALVGWSMFRSPHRYTATVRCESRCRVIRIPRAAFDALIHGDPAVGSVFLRRVAATLADRLERTRDLLFAEPCPEPDAS